MTFLKTSILTAMTTFIKLLSGLIVNKVVAIYIGSAGIAVLGQFQNILSVFLTVGNGGIGSGVTKYIAEYKEDKNKKNSILSAGINITVLFSIPLSFIAFYYSEELSRILLKNKDYEMIFKILSFTLILTSFNTLILAILNGLKRIKLFLLINVLSSIFSLFLTTYLTINYNLFGALLAPVLLQGLVFFITLIIVWKKSALSFKYNIKVHKIYYHKLSGFSLMAIVTILTAPIIQMVIRNYLIENYSIEQAGYWQAVWKVSEMYLLVLTTAFSTYYLPKLSELITNGELRKEIISGYKIIVPFVIVSTVLIYLLKDYIILILYTPEFMEMNDLFLFQLIGNIFKMFSFTLAYLMIAKAMVKTFIITEVIFSVSFYVFTIVFTSYFGLIGVTIAYALNYLIYFVLMIILFRNIVLNKN